MGVADTKKLKLYLRLPEKIIDEQQVKDLHPAIVKVTLPRQKSRRWCTVEFDSNKANSVVKELKSIKINGKKIYVNVHKKKSIKKRVKETSGIDTILKTKH